MPSALLAQEVIETDPVIFSAALGPIPADSPGRAVTVITAEDIEQRQVRNVAEALRQVPGLAVNRTGGVGGLTQIRVRGAEANQVLVLIDGIETANSSNGFDFSTLVITDIERIEVVRGPQSAVFGANAAAGVINIITKRGVRDPNGSVSIGGQVEAGFGSGGTGPSRAVSAFLRAGNAWSDFSFSASYVDDEGFDISGTPDGEQDGIENLNLAVAFSFDPVEEAIISGSFRLTDRRNEFDETAFGCGNSACYVFDAPSFSEGTDIVASLGGEYFALDGALAHKVLATYAQIDETSNGAFGPSTTLTDTTELSYQAAWSFGPADANTVTLGTGYTFETFEGGIGVDESRSQFGLFGEYRGTPFAGFGVSALEDLYLQAGVRQDFNEGFEDAFTWSISASYLVKTTGTRFHASVGEGVVNPTFFEQFGFVPASFTGNPDLVPEENFAFDIGVEQRFFGGDLVIDVTYFNERLDNEIITIFGAVTTVANAAGTSERQGIEVSLSTTPFEGFTATASYTYLDATDADGSAEVRRPQHSGGINLAYRLPDRDAGIALDVTFFGSNTQRNFGDPSFTSPFVRVDGYVLVNLAMDYRLSENAVVFGRIENLLDTDYEEVLGFAGQPLTAFAGVRVEF